MFFRWLCLGFLAFTGAYDNVALKKQAVQLYPYITAARPPDTFDASNAVDGLKSDLRGFNGQCVLSANNKENATWWVNLSTVMSIHHITIYYRTDNVTWDSNNGFTTSFLGFSVYVSNTTDRLQGTLCFKDDNFTRDTIPAVFTTTCPVHGQYVIFYNERLRGVIYPDDYSPDAQNDLCEVEVYGCNTSGYYGSNCSLPCPDVNCQHCHIETGTCQGCKPGYQGHRCEFDCLFGFFGQDCAEKCHEKCSGCNKVNGLCDWGCYPGWKGDNCQQPCDGKLYGENCTVPCGQCYEAAQCHHINGTCLNRCDKGYQGDKCIEECADGTFDYNCEETCRTNCNSCNKKSGVCDLGCKPGWRGQYCEKDCRAGYFGENCSSTCGNCLNIENNSTCHPVTGSCSEGCEHGYQEPTCKEKDKAAQTSLTVVFSILFSVIGLVLMMAGIFVFFKIKLKRSNHNRKRDVTEKNIELSSHGVVQHYDELHVRDPEETYTALKKAEEETPYEEIQNI